MTKFEIYRDVGGNYRWRLKAANGEIVSTSEAYSVKASAVHSANMVKIWAGSATIVSLV